jgi:hypothetical protein
MPFHSRFCIARSVTSATSGIVTRIMGPALCYTVSNKLLQFAVVTIPFLVRLDI